jgi:hypothetical protein
MSACLLVLAAEDDVVRVLLPEKRRHEAVGIDPVTRHVKLRVLAIVKHVE